MIPANADALRRIPDLLSAIERAAPAGNVELSDSRRGQPTLVWIDPAGRRKFLHSPTDPTGEARRVAEAALGPGRARCALLIGHGAGYDIRALAERADELWVIAANLPLLRFLCERLDLSDIFSNASVRWLFGAPSDIQSRLGRMVSGAEAEDAGDVRVVIHPPFVETLPPEFERLLEVVRRIQSGRDTEDVLRPIARENFIQNFSALASPGISGLFGIARGRLAVVAGAGPTLDDFLGDLRRLYDRAVLIAVDTVAEGMTEEGLEPDLIVSVDPRPDSMIHFSGDRASGRAILVFTPITQPGVVRLFEGRRVLAVPRNHFFLQPIEDALAGKGILMGGGSVSILAASVAAALEPACVCLVGIDFRAAPGRFYSGLATYVRDQRLGFGRFSSPETVEQEILSTEIRSTSAGQTTPRLNNYASDFRLLVKDSVVPFYSMGPAPVAGVRSGILPCVNPPPFPRPIRIPPMEAPPPRELLADVGITP